MTRTISSRSVSQRSLMFHYFLICILYLLNWTLNDDAIHAPFQSLLFIYPCMSARTSFTFFPIVLVLKREKSFLFHSFHFRYGYRPSKWVVGGKERKIFLNNFTSFSDYCCKKSGRIILW